MIKNKKLATTKLGLRIDGHDELAIIDWKGQDEFEIDLPFMPMDGTDDYVFEVSLFDLDSL